MSSRRVSRDYGSDQAWVNEIPQNLDHRRVRPRTYEANPQKSGYAKSGIHLPIPGRNSRRPASPSSGPKVQEFRHHVGSPEPMDQTLWPV